MSKSHHVLHRAAEASGIQIVRASDVKPKKLAGLWGGRFHRGKLGFIAGDPGLGKSQLAAYIAARVSSGGDWPFDEGTARRGDVIYITRGRRRGRDNSAAPRSRWS
jgi:RecA-family ATPase